MLDSRIIRINESFSSSGKCLGGKKLYDLDSGILHGVILGHNMKEVHKKEIVQEAKKNNIKILETFVDMDKTELNIKEIYYK